MNAVIAPIVAEHLDRWNDLAQELSGPRRAEWDDYLRRYGLTRHVSFLAQSPSGPMAVLFMEGPGAATLMQRFATSQHPFDQEFRARLEQCHGMSFSAPPPVPPPQLQHDIRLPE